MNSISYDKRLDIFGRDGTHDFKSAAEVRVLVRQLGVRQDDVVLDIGGHIGAFSRLCLKTGASVTTVEPEPDNCELLLRNVKDLPCTLVRAAVTDSPELLAQETTTLYLRGITHTGLHTLFPPKRPARSVTVPIRSCRELIEEVRPTVFKVDIEGGEWLLNWDDLPEYIRAIHVEMHMIPASAGGRERAPVVHKQLLDQGFTATKLPNFRVMWGTHPIYHR